jgi:hypothetical protein
MPSASGERPPRLPHVDNGEWSANAMVRLSLPAEAAMREPPLPPLPTDLCEAEWAALEPLLPPLACTDGPSSDHAACDGGDPLPRREPLS